VHDHGVAGSVGDLPMLGVVVVAAAYALLRERRRQQHHVAAGAAPAAPAAGSDPWLLVLGGASVVAAVIHAVVCPEPFQEYWRFGVFFLVTAVAGLGYAAWVVARPSRRLLRVGVAANLAIVALWLVTRLVGLPLGPEAGATEPFGALDLAASSAELVAAAIAAVLLAAPRRRGSRLLGSPATS
jgi:hypothetical protein